MSGDEMALTSYPDRSCPACQCDTPHHQSISSNPKAEQLTMEQVRSVWSGFFKKKSFFTYHRCQQCGLLFCPRFFSDEQLSQLYQSMSDNTAGVSMEPLIKTQNAYFSMLEKYLPTSRGGYLEFGPDIGLFTKCCVQKKLFDNYWLIEPNAKVWPALQSEMRQEIFQLGTNDDLIDRIPDESISVVVMIHVLDHLIDPAALLARIKPKLKPDAVMLFVTHDESSMLAKVTQSKWPPYCLQHPQLYNKNTIAGLLARLGMRVIANEKTRNYFPVMYLLRHMLFILGIKKLPLPEFNSLQVGLKLGNLLTVASLK